MIKNGDTTYTIQLRAEYFIELADQFDGTMDDEQLADAIDQLTVIYEVYFRGMLAQSDGEQYPPRYPCWYGDSEKQILNQCRVELRDPFGRRCGQVGTALASKNPSASANLFTLSRCYEEFDDGGAERIPEIWRHLHGELECSLAQIDRAREKQPEPIKKKRSGRVADLVDEYIIRFTFENGAEAGRQIRQYEIANDIGCTCSAVSQTMAWQNLVKEKEKWKLPDEDARRRMVMEQSKRVPKPRDEDD